MLRASEPFEFDLKSCDWSPNGEFLVCGGEAGAVYSVSAGSLSEISAVKSQMAKKNKKCWVEDIKISPDGTKAAFGTHGGLSKVELLNIGAGGELTKGRTVNLALTSALSHLDWVSDNSAIVLNTQAYELMWMDIDGGSQISASSARDFDYHTMTCILGFPVQGIFPGPDMTDVNTTCRSDNRRVLATGEDTSLVKLFKHPCVDEANAQSKEFKAHSSHVTKVKFT